MAWKVRRPQNGGINAGCRAVTASVFPTEEISLGMAPQQAAAAFRHAERDAVGSELAAQAKVQAFARGAEYPGASGQWLSRFPSRKRNADEQFRSIAEIASAAARSRGWVAGHGDDLHSCDQRGRQACGGPARQCNMGNFGPKWTQEGKRLRSGAS